MRFQEQEQEEREMYDSPTPAPAEVERLVDEDRICARCEHWYGSHDAGCAAERIAAMITQNT